MLNAGDGPPHVINARTPPAKNARSLRAMDVRPPRAVAARWPQAMNSRAVRDEHPDGHRP
ncbi:hypothetical protein GCM10010423_45250 [Streptomyces levis]|uniref:Uncharacterized protein n=1 Tax=Streptomyces levis TaxID=285566 RepID=A0ABP6B6E0_9ACTN